MTILYANRKALQRQMSKGRATANELDIIVSMTLQLNQAKHSATKKLRKALRSIERKLRAEG